MIGFNPSNIYALLYGASTYGDSSIFTDLGNWIGAFVQILVFFNFYSALVISILLYSYVFFDLHFIYGYFIFS